MIQALNRYAPAYPSPPINSVSSHTSLLNIGLSMQDFRSKVVTVPTWSWRYSLLPNSFYPIALVPRETSIAAAARSGPITANLGDSQHC